MNKLAQIDFGVLEGELPEFKFWGSTPGAIIGSIIPYVMTAAGMMLLLYIIFGGLTLMLAQGDPKKVQLAKARITNAAIGFVIVLVSYWIVQLVAQVLGIEEIQNVFSG